MEDIEPEYPPLSYVYAWAIKNQQPVWRLEELRAQVCFGQEPELDDWYYSPSNALTHAVTHNHIPYARYLLMHFPVDSMKVRGSSFSSHLGLAITHNRREILTMIIETSRKVPHLRSYINLERYTFLWDGKTPLQMACELLRSDLILILLRYGATSAANISGHTPMDVILTQVSRSRDNMQLKVQCLDHLLLFAPRTSVRMRRTLQENCEYWATILGEKIYAYLLGKRPAPLGLMCMKKVLQQLPPSNLLGCIQQLPIPNNLTSRFSLGH